MNVTVLRLGHRFERDKRISTHLALVSRAFGAVEIVFDSEDVRVKESVDAISRAWGGDFKVSFTESWKKFIKNFDGIKVHLTMYGIHVNDFRFEKLTNAAESGEKNVLVIVGGKKVPSDLYELADYNIGVGNQPHSEVAALCVFLDRLFSGSELNKDFKGKQKIIPQERGKKLEKTGIN